LALQMVDRLDQEDLLVQRLGLAVVAVLEVAGLQEADRGEAPDAGGAPKVAEVVLMVGAIGAPDRRDRARGEVLGACG
jgi:hypothetical protein